MTLKIIDQTTSWKERFRAHYIFWARIANLNPERGLVCTNRNGIRQLYAWNSRTGSLRQVTATPAGVSQGLISADGEWIYYLRDDHGSEIGHYVRVPFTGGREEDITPDLSLYNSYEIHQSYSGKVVGIWASDTSGQMIFILIPGQKTRRIYLSQSLFYGPALSYYGEIAVIATTEGTNSSDTKLVAFDLASGERLAEYWEGPGVAHTLGEFSPIPGDLRFLTTSSASGYARPAIWNPILGDWRNLSVDNIPGEINPMGWSKDGRQVLLSQLNQARQQLYLYNLEDDIYIRLQHPQGVFGSGGEGAHFTADGKIWITWQDTSHPPRLVALDAASGQVVNTLLSAGEAPAGKTWQSIQYASVSGDVVQGWLALPEGKGPFPTILHTHGGPLDVMLEQYAPECQAWLDQGFAYLTINYHGSTTFGKPYEKSILGKIGELEVQDMVAGYHWLVQNGIALPDAVFLSGNSYGGFLTLLAMGQSPEYWAGGMAGIAIADMKLLYEDENETMRSFQRMLFGGTPQEIPEAYRKSSPITYAEQFQAPVLVIQGINDTRSVARQMKAFEDRLKSLGKQIEVCWFNAGHGSNSVEQQIEHLEIKLQFASRLLQKSTA